MGDISGGQGEGQGQEEEPPGPRAVLWTGLREGGAVGGEKAGAGALHPRAKMGRSTQHWERVTVGWPKAAPSG